MKEENRLQEETTSLQTTEKNEVVTTSSIPFATIGSGFGLNPEVAKKVMAAPKLNFNTRATTWSPEKAGERKRLVYQGIKEKAKTKNIFSDEPEFVYLDKAVFVEIFEDNEETKQKVIEMFGTVIISYLRENNVPRHAIMDIVYVGKSKAKSGMMYDDFEIIIVPVEF